MQERVYLRVCVSHTLSNTLSLASVEREREREREERERERASKQASTQASEERERESARARQSKRARSSESENESEGRMDGGRESDLGREGEGHGAAAKLRYEAHHGHKIRHSPSASVFWIKVGRHLLCIYNKQIPVVHSDT